MLKKNAWKKSKIEVFKEWAGVISLFVSLAYTFPMGVWDRFYVTAEQRNEKDLESVREVLVKLTQLDTGLSQKNASDVSENQKQFNSGSVFTEKSAILATVMPKIKLHYKELSLPELATLGLQLGSLGSGSFAEQVYDYAMKEASGDHQMLGGLHSARAVLYSPGGAIGVSLQKARSEFRAGLTEYQKLPQDISPGATATIALQWSVFEMAVGDKNCAEYIFGGSEKSASALNPYWADGTREQLKQLASKRALIAADVGTECSADIVPWDFAKWPWRMRSIVESSSLGPDKFKQ